MNDVTDIVKTVFNIVMVFPRSSLSLLCCIKRIGRVKICKLFVVISYTYKTCFIKLCFFPIQVTFILFWGIS